MFGSESRVWLNDNIAFTISLIPFALLLLIIVVSLLEAKHRSIRLFLMSNDQRMKATAATVRARTLSQIIANAPPKPAFAAQTVHERPRRNR